MYFLVLSFSVVAIPYALEWFWFKRRFGLFAALFWLLVVQYSVLFGGEIILKYQLGQSLPRWSKSVGTAFGFFSFMTIAMTPLAATLAALVAMIMIAVERFNRKRSDKSD